jgi:hypothetical protein
MAYLRLSNPTTDSCDFKVNLSNPFNRDYYRELRITGTNYGSSTSNVSRYVESVTARNSSSTNVYGVVNDGMSAGRTYTLYAYAQAQNGTWYRAGSDTITMKNSGSSSREADLRIDRITEYTDVDEFKVGEEVKFKVRVENRGNAESSDYTVKVYDEDGNTLDHDNENELEAGDYDNAYLYVTINKSGRQRLKFYISGGESDDRTEYKTYTWSGGASGGRYNSRIGEIYNFKVRDESSSQIYFAGNISDPFDYLQVYLNGSFHAKLIRGQKYGEIDNDDYRLRGDGWYFEYIIGGLSPNTEYTVKVVPYRNNGDYGDTYEGSDRTKPAASTGTGGGYWFADAIGLRKRMELRQLPAGAGIAYYDPETGVKFQPMTGSICNLNSFASLSAVGLKDFLIHKTDQNMKAFNPNIYKQFLYKPEHYNLSGDLEETNDGFSVYIGLDIDVGAGLGGGISGYFAISYNKTNKEWTLSAVNGKAENIVVGTDCDAGVIVGFVDGNENALSGWINTVSKNTPIGDLTVGGDGKNLTVQLKLGPGAGGGTSVGTSCSKTIKLLTIGSFF